VQATTEPATTTTTTTGTEKNFNSFFMTQDDDLEEDLKSRSVICKKGKKKEEVVSERVDSYDLLMNIENEEEIRVPRDVQGSVRVLKQMLSNPLVFRDTDKIRKSGRVSWFFVVIVGFINTVNNRLSGMRIDFFLKSLSDDKFSG